MLKAVILIGGPSKGTRFRPLSLDIPKPLFPVAGLPVIQHHIDACYRLGQKNCTVSENNSDKYRVGEVLLLGYYIEEELTNFLLAATKSYPSLKIRYLREPDALGTAGGLYYFRDTILSPLENEQIQAFFVMNGDVCSDFPLKEMLDVHFKSHQNQPVIATVMATETTRHQSVHYGCMVVDKDTNIIQHYVEKPSTFVSTTVNCGVYVCSPQLFDTMADIYSEISIIYENSSKKHTSISVNKNNTDQQKPNGEKVSNSSSLVLWMEKDILRRLAGEFGSNCKNTSQVESDYQENKKSIRGGIVLAAITHKWWSQLKTAGAAIYVNRHYLAISQQQLQKELFFDNVLPLPVKFRKTITDSNKEYLTIGNVWIHKSATVHPTALLGPNVSISEGAYIGKGVRIKESIILENAAIHKHSLIMHSIIGRHANIGSWCRVEGSSTSSDINPNVAYAKITPQLPLFNVLDGRLNPSITILGCDVKVESEVILFNCVVLPYKTLTRSYKNEIIL